MRPRDPSAGKKKPQTNKTQIQNQNNNKKPTKMKQDPNNYPLISMYAFGIRFSKIVFDFFNCHKMFPSFPGWVLCFLNLQKQPGLSLTSPWAGGKGPGEADQTIKVSVNSAH